MIQRWSVWHVVRYAILATALLLALLIHSLRSPGYADAVEVSNGSELAVPPQEPNDRVDLADLDVSGLTAEEIQAILRSNLDAEFATDTTKSFDVTATVNNDRSATITEDIVQVFRSTRRGIERTIPIRTNEGTSMVRSLQVSTSAGTPADVLVTDVPDGILVRIGDPDVFITGTHAYRLTYVLENVVSDDGRSVLLDAITEWRQRIESLTYRLVIPGTASEVTCFVGAFQSTEPCGSSNVTTDGGTFAAGRMLEANEGFTVGAVFVPSSLQPSAATTAPARPIRTALVLGGVMYAAIALGFLITMLRARQSLALAARSVTLTFEGPSQQALPTRAVRGASLPPPLPSDAALDAPLEFVPPLLLDPASMIRLRDGARVDVPTMLAATLVDLAADGVIGLQRNDEGSQWTIHRIDQPPRGVTQYEEHLLKALLGDEHERVLDDRANEVGSAIPGFLGAVDTGLHGLGLMKRAALPALKVTSAATTAASLIATAIFSVLVVGFSVAALSSSGRATALMIAIAVGASAIVLLLSALFGRTTTKQYTDRGRGAVHRIRGFERFFRDSEALHAQIAGNLGVYREYMGYAVAFDHLDDWVGSMPEEVARSLQGVLPVAAVSTIAHYPLWRNAHTHHRAAMARARSGPSRFGGGGGFSGGGFSGGGRGGGGGGSW